MTKDQTLNRIMKVWKKYPDLRLFQLFVAAGVHNWGVSKDSFYLPNEELIKLLEDWDKKREEEHGK